MSPKVTPPLQPVSPKVTPPFRAVSPKVPPPFRAVSALSLKLPQSTSQTKHPAEIPPNHTK